MDLRQQLITTADTFASATGRRRARVSTMVFNQGQRLDRIADGTLSPSIDSFERAMRWFAANWPAGAEWPDDVPRPLPHDLTMASPPAPHHETVDRGVA